MLFNSYEFIFFFLPVSGVLFYLAKKAAVKYRLPKLPRLLLLFLSLWFYSFQNRKVLPLLLLSMGVNYLLYRGMLYRREQTGRDKKGWLFAAVIWNLGLLFFFKYSYGIFLFPSLSGSFTELAIPLGISFFTFSQLAFQIDAFRGKSGEVSLIDYCVYIAFFPKIAEGPIMLPKDFFPELQNLQEKHLTAEKAYRALCLFILGLSKKLLMADTFGRAADYGYQNLAGLNTADAWIVALSYTLQIYFDFSGYCDMAMGIAALFGFTLPVNFDSPYQAGNILEFWKRWHKTLTAFFTEYLYIPLGGNRKGKWRTCGNILIVFLVSGIWHGAGITFVIWGLLHGILYVLTRWYRKHKNGMGLMERGRAGRILSTGLTFLYVNTAWVFFRAPSVSEALMLIRTMGGFKGGRPDWNLAGCFNLDEFWYLLKLFRIDRWQYSHYILMFTILPAALLIVFFAENAVRAAGKYRPGISRVCLLAFLAVWCVISMSSVSSFIYVNF